MGLLVVRLGPREVVLANRFLGQLAVGLAEPVEGVGFVVAVAESLVDHVDGLLVLLLLDVQDGARGVGRAAAAERDERQENEREENSRQGESCPGHEDPPNNGGVDVGGSVDETGLVVGTVVRSGRARQGTGVQAGSAMEIE